MNLVTLRHVYKEQKQELPFEDPPKLATLFYYGSMILFLGNSKTEHMFKAAVF